MPQLHGASLRSAQHKQVHPPARPSHRKADALRAAQAGHGVEKKIKHKGCHSLRRRSVKSSQLVRHERARKAGRKTHRERESKYENAKGKASRSDPSNILIRWVGLGSKENATCRRIFRVPTIHGRGYQSHQNQSDPRRVQPHKLVFRLE